jgi:hypothetical protein
MKASLKRPFEGAGATYALGITDGNQTRLVQEYQTTVRESWIVKWFGGAIGETILDYENGPEREAGVFLGQAFDALSLDLLAAAPAPPR